MSAKGLLESGCGMSANQTFIVSQLYFYSSSQLYLYIYSNCICIIEIALQSSCQQKASLKASVACRQIRRLLFYCFAHHQIFTSLHWKRRNNERSIENAAVLDSWLLKHLRTSVRPHHISKPPVQPNKPSQDHVKPLMSEMPFSS